MSEIQGNGPTMADFAYEEARVLRDEIREAKARLERLEVRTPEEAAAPPGPVEGDIGPPPDGPVPIVGDPGWIPDAPPVSRQTTTEIVATLQQRYPEDAEVRALIGKVTGARASVTAANDRAAKAECEANALRRALAEGKHEVFAVYSSGDRGDKAELQSVRLTHPSDAEVNSNCLVVERCLAVRDDDGRLCLLEPVPFDLEDDDE